MKHTPEPWFVLAPEDTESATMLTIFSGAGDDIGEVYYGTMAPKNGDPLANAAVIEAAPELLSTLKALQRELREHIKLDVRKHYSLMVANMAADKAIMKAEGHTS